MLCIRYTECPYVVSDKHHVTIHPLELSRASPLVSVSLTHISPFGIDHRFRLSR